MAHESLSNIACVLGVTAHAASPMVETVANAGIPIVLHGGGLWRPRRVLNAASIWSASSTNLSTDALPTS